tara:strand:- start:88 stop:633 length:546 start_codon:yes stop_codon:yes gene_type:complete
MVRNKTGGNKAKKFARKNIGNNTENKKIRFVKEEDEMYGIVTKMIGNGQCIVLGIDERERLCMIRNKFSGRNKHSNLITVGSWVMFGRRSWETPKDGKLEKCDMLEVYSNNEKHILIQEGKHNMLILQKQENKMNNIGNNSSFEDEENILMSVELNEEQEIDTTEEVQNKLDFDDIDFDEI